MREVIRREAKNQTGDVRGWFGAYQGSYEHVHRQRGTDERREQQEVVAEDEIMGQRVERPKGQRLQQQVIGIRERVGGREKDVGVEYAAG